MNEIWNVQTTTIRTAFVGRVRSKNKKNRKRYDIVISLSQIQHITIINDTAQKSLSTFIQT